MHLLYTCTEIKMRYKQLQFHDRYNSETVIRFRPNSEGRVGTNSEDYLGTLGINAHYHLQPRSIRLLLE